MRTPDRLPDEALDSLLDGSPSEEAVGTPLVAYLEAVRHDAVTTRPRPSDELGVVLAEGLDPAEMEARGILTATAGAPATSWRRRGRLVLRALTAKFAALGILGKAAAAGAAVTVAASGAGAAGVLPPPAQSTFNEVIGREAPADPADEGAADTEIPADTSDTEPLDTNVPGDATSDGEAGVDGGDVADDASDGQGDAADEGDVEQQPVQPQDTPAGDRIDDTPADEVPEDAPPTPTPAPERPATRDGAAEEGDGEQGEVEQRPDTTDGAPRVRRPSGTD